MKKLIRLAVVALIAGLGGGTGIAVLTAPPAAVGSTGAHLATAGEADSTTIVTAPRDTAVADSGAAAADSIHAVAAPDSSAPQESVPAKPVARASGPATVTGGSTADSTARVQLRRISRTFANMSPRDAAKVLELMDNDDITTIIASLTEKQTAAILAALNPQRAAVISSSRLQAARGQRP